jgi:hypothetical protein
MLRAFDHSSFCKNGHFFSYTALTVFVFMVEADSVCGAARAESLTLI